MLLYGGAHNRAVALRLSVEVLTITSDFFLSVSPSAPACFHGFAFNFGFSQRLEGDQTLAYAHGPVANSLKFAFAFFAAAFISPVCFVYGWHYFLPLLHAASSTIITDYANRQDAKSAKGR